MICVSVALIPVVTAFNNEVSGVADAGDGEIVASGKSRAAVRAAALVRWFARFRLVVFTGVEVSVPQVFGNL